MALRVRGAGEFEDGGRGDGDGDAVGDYGGGGHVAGVFVAGILAADGVAHAVAEMDACVSEADACEGGGEEHLRLRFVVVWVFGRAGEVLDGCFQCLEGEDVGDGVGALVGWAVYGV